MAAGYVVLGLVAGLASLERKSFLQAMLSRPVALGPIVGLVLGDVQAGLFVGVPLELLWLGEVNLGAALPVHEALATAASAGGTVLAARSLEAAGVDGPAVLPAVAVLAVALCAPLAAAGRWTDAVTERWNERLYVRAEQALSGPAPEAAAFVNLWGLALPFAVGFVLAPAGAAIAAAAIQAVLARAPAAAAPLAIGWAAFVGLACAAGASAMRGARASRLYLAALALGVVAVASTALGVRSW